jgi:hypothetical protein
LVTVLGSMLVVGYTSNAKSSAAWDATREPRTRAATRRRSRSTTWATSWAKKVENVSALVAYAVGPDATPGPSAPE